LIGRISNDTVEITDAVPLFHSQIPLLPQLEISLILVTPLLGFYKFFIFSIESILTPICYLSNNA
jgi:hypothetical protein